MQLGETSMDDLIASGDAKVVGRRQAWDEFMGLLDSFPFWFPIVTP